MQRGIIWNKQVFFGYFAWPTIARLPDGRLIVVCSGFRVRHVCPFGKVTAFYSEDEGRSWSSPVVLSDSFLDDRDAGVCVSGEKIILTTFTSGKDVQKKYMDMWYRQRGMEKENKFIESYLEMIDENIEKEQLGSFIMSGNGYCFSERKRMMKNINAPHGPFKRNGGGFYYIGESRCFSGEETQGEIYLVESIDGIEWRECGKIQIPENSLRFCECHGLQLPSGKIIIQVRAQGEGSFMIWQCESEDLGQTFSLLHPIIDDGAPPHLLLHSTGALICSYANRILPHAGPRIAVSYDNGKSWKRRLILREDAAGEDIGYSSSAELVDGKIITVYYFTDKKGQDKTALEYVIWDLGESK